MSSPRSYTRLRARGAASTSQIAHVLRGLWRRWVARVLGRERRARRQLR